MSLVHFCCPFVFSLLGVGYYVILERKVLGYIMLRKGPNKVGFIGLMQPFSDAGKLFCKEVVVPKFRNVLPFVLCPIASLFISLMLWVIYPFDSRERVIVWGIIYYLAVSGVRVYAVMAAG